MRADDQLSLNGELAQDRTLVLNAIRAKLKEDATSAAQVAALAAELRHWLTPAVDPAKQLAALVAVAESGPNSGVRLQAAEAILQRITGEALQ